MSNALKEAVEPWSHGSLIYNYLYNRYLSPLMLWFRTPLMAICTTLCDKVCQWLKTLLSSTNKTVCHDIAEILLKVGLNTISPNQSCMLVISYMYVCDVIDSSYWIGESWRLKLKNTKYARLIYWYRTIASLS